MKGKVKLISNPKSEFQHQENVFSWALIWREQYPSLALLHSIPNGGTRDTVEAVNLKRTGLKPGVPDMCLPVARGKYHGLYIELKTETGKASLEQEWWIENLSRQGYFATVAHGWESAIRVIEWYLSLREGDK